MKKRLLSAFLSLSMVLTLVQTETFANNAVNASTSSNGKIEIGDCIQLGKYYGQPIVWRCVAIDENGPLMLSDKILCLKAYDAKGNSDYHYVPGTFSSIRKQYGSNCYADSNIRQWLNSTETQVSWTHDEPSTPNVLGGNAYNSESGFLSSGNFSAEERSYMKNVTRKVYTNEAENTRGITDGGSREHNGVDGLMSAQNRDYTNCYYMYVTDTVFIPDLDQMVSVYYNLGNEHVKACPTEQAVTHSDYSAGEFNSETPYKYWVTHAGTNGFSYEWVRFIAEDGTCTGSRAWDGAVGIRPAFYLDESVWNNGGGVNPSRDEITFRSDDNFAVNVGDNTTILASIPNTSGLQQSDITWSSSSENVATIESSTALIGGGTASATVTIQGVSPGTATITVNISDGRTASCEITIREPFTGTCGDNLTWTLTDGTLTISGTGAMETFKLSDSGSKTSAPWYAYRNEITKVVLEDGITSISANAFRNHLNLVDISIPASVTSIGNYAIYLCAGIGIHFAGNAPRFDVPTFEGLSRATVYYPAENNTWTKDIRHNYRHILWQPTGLDRGNRITMLEDTWNFANLTSDIPLYCYNDLFGLAEAYYLWGIAKLSGRNGAKGTCFGMVATAINSFNKTPSVTSYGVNRLFDVDPKDQCSAPKLQTAEDFINFGYVYQYSLAVQMEMLSNKNDLQKLYQAVVDYENGGLPVSISVNDNHGGHQVLALSVKDYNEFSIISVYDCNYPNEIRPIYLYKTKGEFTDWEFQFQWGEIWEPDSNYSISYNTKSANLYNDIGRTRLPYADDPTLLSTNGATLNISNGKQSATAIGNESSNTDLIVPISYVETVRADSEESTAYLYWVSMGEELEFVDAVANSNLMIAAGDNGIGINTSAQSIITVNVSAALNDKSVQIETTDGQSNNTTTLVYYGNGGNNVLKIVTIEAVTDSVLSSTDNKDGIEISGIKSLSIQTEYDAVALPSTSEDYSYQIEAEDGKIVSVKADTNDDNVYDTTIYTSKEGTTPYTIIFNANGGTVIPTTITTNGDGKLTELPTPVRNRYNFNGWFTALTGGDRITINTVFTSDATVYAQWTYNSNIFDGNNRYPSTGKTTPTTYRIIVPTVSGGTVNVSPTSGKKGDTVTITVSPDSGYELDYITATDKNGDNVLLTDRGNGKYALTMPEDNVMLSYAFKLIKTDSPNLSTVSFIDMIPGVYYYDAVVWAVGQGITNGTTATTFSPDAPCTRGQIVTFLWRAAGSPSVSGNNPFTDVNPGDYWYDAVLWAVSKGITDGTSATTFSPNNICTRGQAVTFLYRNVGSPAVTTSAAFTDVVPGTYYSNAVAWALAKNITNGTTATTFSPDDRCSRGQIATFLYRNLGE